MKPTLSDLDDFPVSPLFKRPDLNMGHRQNSGVPSLQRCQKYFKRLALAPYSESILSRKMVIRKLGGGSKFSECFTEHRRCNVSVPAYIKRGW